MANTKPSTTAAAALAIAENVRGVGGSYTRQPGAQSRKLLERTQPQEPRTLAQSLVEVTRKSAAAAGQTVAPVIDTNTPTAAL